MARRPLVCARRPPGDPAFFRRALCWLCRNKQKETVDAAPIPRLCRPVGRSGGPALAQETGPAGPPVGWTSQVDGLALWQGEADLDTGGSFEARRVFLRGGGIYRFATGNSVGVFASLGELQYDFSGVAPAPWGDIRDLRLSVPVRLRLDSGASVFLVPSLRYDYEDGASQSDGETYGALAGITWEAGPNLTIGPGFGAFTELGADDDWDIFPILLVDWRINDQWRLSTGDAIGATQGPGLSLRYQHTDDLSFALGARYENVRFRLDGTGPAPGGVGEDEAVPVVISMRYEPTPFASFTAYAGAEFGGSLTLENAAGAVISRTDYDTAPVAGLAFRLRF